MTTVSPIIERCFGPLSQVPKGEGRQFDIDGHLIAVFHLRSGEVCATQADCPHRGGPLADGIVGGTTVICPLHARKYDVVTGQAAADECVLATYPARVDEQGHIMVAFTGRQ